MHGNKLTTFLKSFAVLLSSLLSISCFRHCLLAICPFGQNILTYLKMACDSAKRCSQKSLIY